MSRYTLKWVWCIILLVCCMFTSVSLVSAESEEYHIVTDMAGNDVLLPVHLDHVACMSATCETALIAMGQTDKMAYTAAFAQGDFSFTNKLVPGFENVERINGGLTYEEMLARGIQVVFVKSKSNVTKLNAAGIPAFYLEFNTIEQTKESIRLMGDIFGVPEIADSYIRYIDTYIPLIEERLSLIPENERVTVYAPLLRSSDNTILNTYDPSHISTEMLSLCGGYMVTQDIAFTDNNGILTEEALIAADPDVIFVCGFYRDKGYSSLTDGTYDGVLQAVDTKRIYYFPLGIYDWSAGGFELGLSGLWCAKTLYPEYFADIDIRAVTKQYYYDTTGVELSDEDIDYIFMGN